MKAAKDLGNDQGSDSVLYLTDSARDKIIQLMNKDNKDEKTWALRVGVIGGGCSGFSYKMSFDQEPKAGDIDFEENGIRIFVDPKSALFMQGLRIDYKDGLEASGFSYENPKATKSCGCGTSFAV